MTAPLPRALAVSALLHASLAVLLMQPALPVRATLPTLFPLKLVGKVGGSSGRRAAEPAPPASAPAPADVVAAIPRPTPKPTRPRRTEPAPRREAPPAATAPPGEATPGGTGVGEGRGSGTGAGDGVGEGSGGGGDARVAYGQSPPPPYPSIARRLGKEGLVMLDVRVGQDGAVLEARVARSSGCGELDDAARRTVETRWRFVPATRDGRPVEGRASVPIRFRLAGRSDERRADDGF